MIVGIILEATDVKIRKQQQEEAVARNTELSGKIENLNVQNKKLIEQNKDYLKDLREKDIKIEEIDRKAKMSARGITSIYTFNGNRRENTAGSITLSGGPEREIFKQMVDLEKSKNYSALIKLCEQQIKKTSDWYTPYFYLGVSQANMGLKDEAIENIRYAVDNTPGDTEYAEAREILERLEQQP